MKLMKIFAKAVVVGALGFTAFGLGAGAANASPPSPVVSGTPWAQDGGHGRGHGGCGDDGCGGGNWGDQGNWGGGGNWGAPGWNGAPIGCISGPVGWGTGFICI
jgi:hypothetical protein